jgi:hypothetical protein
MFVLFVLKPFSPQKSNDENDNNDADDHTSNIDRSPPIAGPHARSVEPLPIEI